MHEAAKKSQLIKFVVLALSVGLLANCATTSQQISGATSMRDVSELHDWTATGRIGVSGIEQSGSGSFNWTQQADGSRMEVRGPVGVGSMQLTLQGKQLTLRTGDGTQYDAEQVMDALQTRLGAPVPVMQLRYWLLGLAAPGTHAWSDATHAVLDQDGWHIAYNEWAQRGDLRLPVKLILNRDALRIVIVVQSWQLQS